MEGRGQPGWGSPLGFIKGRRREVRGGLMGTGSPSEAVAQGAGRAPLESHGGGVTRSLPRQ